MAQHALEIGRDLAHDPLCALTSVELGISRNQELSVEEALQYYRQARVYTRRVKVHRFDGSLLHHIPTALILLGRFDEAEAIAREAYESALHTTTRRHYSLTLGAIGKIIDKRINVELSYDNFLIGSWKVRPRALPHAGTAV
jgi:hypothetical protein